jgi:hypothetical protein
MQFISKYALPVSQTKGMLKNMLTKDLTATVVWNKSVPWLDLVGLVGVDLVGVGFYMLARVIRVGSWELAYGSGLVGIGSWALICENRLLGVVRGSRPGVEGNQIPLLEVCFIALLVGYSCDIN